MIKTSGRNLGTIMSLNSRGENPPKIVVIQLGAASRLVCVIINPESNQKLKHQLQKIEILKQQNYHQNG